MQTSVRFAAVLVLVTTSGFAAETPPPANPPAADPKDEIVCKNMADQTGSRLGNRRECHTVREWEERRADDRQMTERAQQSDRRGPQ
jgi:hypothetical protein